MMIGGLTDFKANIKLIKNLCDNSCNTNSHCINNAYKPLITSRCYLYLGPDNHQVNDLMVHWRGGCTFLNPLCALLLAPVPTGTEVGADCSLTLGS